MSTFALENEDLCQALRRRVKHYKREHPALSSQQIAKKFNMSSSTLNRIENQDIKNPTIDQVLKVLRGTGETNDLLGFIEEYYPDIADTYKRVYKDNGTAEFLSSDTESYFVKEDYFRIMLLAFTGDGTSHEEILSLFGKQGEKKLRELVVKEIITLKANGKLGAPERDYNLSQESMKHLLSMTIKECYKSNELGKSGNFLAMMTKSIDRKKISKEIGDILDDTRKKVLKVLNNPENKGEDKYFVGLVADELN